jgi:hypothetical protein
MQKAVFACGSMVLYVYCEFFFAPQCKKNTIRVKICGLHKSYQKKIKRLNV